MEVAGGRPAIAEIAALIGEPARAEVLTALLADRALSATELASIAAVSRPTISVHLDKLLRAGLVAAEKQGRHKYFRLSDPDVAQALESLMGVAWRTGALRVSVGPADAALRRARVCYDHLAGELGVFVYESLVGTGALVPAEGAAVELTPAGEALFDELDIGARALRAQRRSFCRSCLDWSERRHHLAGALGAALLSRAYELGWASRVEGSRAVRFSPAGEAALRRAVVA